MMYQLPERQKKVLKAIALEGKCETILSGDFASKYRLPSVSSINSAIKGLQDRNLLMVDKGSYAVYDKFMELWIKQSDGDSQTSS